MPKSGFKSITVTETIYDNFHEKYTKKKEELSMKGISSFAGYITSVLTKALEDDQ
jgi:hypothetical protein